MPGISSTPYRSFSPLGKRRGISDLASFSLDLTWADKRAESVAAARSRAYPSPPMSGSPPPPKSRLEAGDRGQVHGSYSLPPQPPHNPQDAYRTHHHQSHPEDIRAHLPTSLPPPPSLRSYPPPPDTSDRMGYYRPAEPPLPRRLSYPPPGPSNLAQQQPPYASLPPVVGQPHPYPTSSQTPTQAPTSFEPPRPARKAKGHVASACVPCKKAHLRYVPSQLRRMTVSSSS